MVYKIGKAYKLFIKHEALYCQSIGIYHVTVYCLQYIVFIILEEVY